MVQFGSKMIHNMHSMTVERHVMFDETKNLKYLKRWFNILPSFLFKIHFDKYIRDFNILKGSEDEEDNISEETYRQIMYTKILQLKNLYTGIYNIMITMNKNDTLKLKVGLKIASRTTNVNIYIEKVNELTGIEIIDIETLNKFNKFIEHKNDKYIESFENIERLAEDQDQKTMTFMQLALGVFSVMDMNYNPKLKIFVFWELEKLAVARVRKSNMNPNGEE